MNRPQAQQARDKRERLEVRKLVAARLARNPNLSVKQLLREAERAGLVPRTEDVKRVRHEMREAVMTKRAEVERLAIRPVEVDVEVDLDPGDELKVAEVPVPKPVPVEAPPPPPLPDEDDEEPEEVEVEEEDEEEEEAAEGDVRMELARQMLEKDPSVHPMEIILAQRKQYGMAANNERIYEMCREARVRHGLKPIAKRVRQNGPKVDAVEALTRAYVEKLRATGLTFSSLALTVNERWEVEFAYDLKRSSTGKFAL